ncbi:N-acetylmuramoyl-L-alanine amidase [Cognatiluteimonas profundi]|uniref:N-acetylmuramoyl-L-alanine amidase n=1 Tax=Cognatiluteimonas profundi TaxID=2594501 RepID=UPI002D7F6C28|nr:N-acetylmuramoyl-L-alanine amidase [Lysobacter profundi]
MRTKGASFQQFLLGMALIAAVCWNLARAGELKDLELSTGPAGTRAELAFDRESGFQLITLANPDRLVVDLPGSRQRPGLRMPAGTGLVRQVRSGQPVPGTTRVVFDLAAPVSAMHPHFEPGATGPRLVLEWPGDGNLAAGPVQQTAAVATGMTPPPTAAARIEGFATVQPRIAEPAASGAAARDDIVASSTAPSVQASPGTVATGVPTRVATGRPAVIPDVATTRAPDGAPVKTMQDVMRRAGLRPLIIAIDAGHGGQDPGARGPGGSREKMITLAIARELARQVNATPGLKAFLIRDADVFVPLTQRYQRARSARADLFVSIHADASPSPDASGSSVFVLSQRGASSQAARWLATQENAADLVGGVKLQDKDDTLASVLLDLSQSATMQASEDTANQVLGGLKRLGKTHKQEIERANFVVLRSPDVPSLLVETAFITNPSEERRLNDPAQQAQLARAVLDGVNSYFRRQPPPGTLYAARADAAGSFSGTPGGGSP